MFSESDEIRFEAEIEEPAELVRKYQCSAIVFRQLSSMILERCGVDRLLNFIVQEAPGCLYAQRATVHLLDEKSGAVKIQCARSLQPEFSGVGLVEERAVVQMVFEDSKPRLVANSNDLERMLDVSPPQTRLCSLIAVPISLQGRTVKVFSVVSVNELCAFDENDLQSMLLFANLASIGIEISAMMADLRKAAGYRRNYEQSLADMQDQLQELGKMQQRNLEENIGKFLPPEEGGNSGDYTEFSKALSRTYDLPTISLKGFTLNPSLQKLVGEQYAATHRIVVFKNMADKIKVALAEPTKYLMDEIRKVVPRGRKVEFYLAGPDEVRSCFRNHPNPFSLTHYK